MKHFNVSLDQDVRTKEKLASIINRFIPEPDAALAARLAEAERALAQCFECRHEADKINVITQPFIKP